MTRRLLATWLVAFVAVLAGSVGPAALGERLTEAQSSADLLALARVAIGGEIKLASVKSIGFVGDMRALNQAYGRHPDAREEYVNKKVELQAVWPSRYFLTKTTILPDGQALTPFRSGFDGDTNVGGTFSANVGRLDFARWMLLFLLRTDTAIPLTLAPKLNQDGELQFGGPHNLRCSIALNPASHVPVGLRMTVMRAGPDGFPGSETLREIVTSVVSRRQVDGISVPDHLVVKDSAGKVLEEYWFRSIQINPPLSAGDLRR